MDRVDPEMNDIVERGYNSVVRRKIMRQMRKNTNLSIYLLCATQIYSIYLIILLLIREIFINDYC